MSSLGVASLPPAPSGVQIPPMGYEAMLWSSAAVPFIFVVCRLYVRARVFRKLFVDDALVVLAWLIQVTYCATQQAYIVDVYYVVDLGLGLVQPDAHLSQHFANFQIASATANILHAIGLWTVKFSFLVFFRRLGSGVRHQKIIWWVVAGLNAACFAVWIGVPAWSCLTHPFLEVAAQCATSSAEQYALKVPKIQTSVDILSDCAILVIPFTLLWKVRLRWQQKVSLGSIFSLTLFVMAASIIRTQGTVEGNQALNESWLYGWTAVELGVAIIVACLASFRALFTGPGTSQGSYSGPGTGELSTGSHGLARLQSRLFRRSHNSMDAESGLVDRKSPLLGPPHTTHTHVSASGLPEKPRGSGWNRLEVGELNYPDQVYVHTKWKQSSMRIPNAPRHMPPSTE